MPLTKAGLEDVVAANSAICDIIGGEGKLTYRGIDIHELALHSSFEETTYLLWFGSLPAEASLRQFTADLAARRRLPDEIIALVRRLRCPCTRPRFPRGPIRPWSGRRA